jgi:hypothetical protein
MKWTNRVRSLIGQQVCTIRMVTETRRQPCKHQSTAGDR